MSQRIVPNWNLRQQRQVEGEEAGRSPHVHPDQNLTYVVPMCNNDEVTELTWQNGQISVHGLSKGGDSTLESLVRQATNNFNFPSSSTSQQQKWRESSSRVGEKRMRCEESASGSARDTNTTIMTWPSTTADDQSIYHDCSENQDGEGTTKGESCRSQSSAPRSRAAAIHNLSERRRRDRINQKMKTLQKLVPNASKTDKASMLDEVIEYLKQLQAQVQMMSNARNMVMPMGMGVGMQQQLQMSLMARMGMGMGMGMLDMNNLARNAAPSFVSPPFTMPPVQLPPPPKSDADVSASIPNFNDAYNTFLAQQSMNMDFLNKMSGLYRQQGSSQQPSKKPTSLSLPNHAQSNLL